VIDDATGEPFVWRPMPVVVPVSDRLRQQLAGEEHQRLADAAAAAHAFRLVSYPWPARAMAMGR